MASRSLKRRPTWFRYAFILAILFVIVSYANIRNSLNQTGGYFPYYPFVIMGFLSYIAYLFESAWHIAWDDHAVRGYDKMLFLQSSKSDEVRFADIVSCDDGRLSNQAASQHPFTTIEISDGVTTIYIFPSEYFREGIQQLVRDIAKARPDLTLTPNLQAFVDGEFDGHWS